MPLLVVVIEFEVDVHINVSLVPASILKLIIVENVLVIFLAKRIVFSQI